MASGITSENGQRIGGLLADVFELRGTPDFQQHPRGGRPTETADVVDRVQCPLYTNTTEIARRVILVLSFWFGRRNLILFITFGSIAKPTVAITPVMLFVGFTQLRISCRLYSLRQICPCLASTAIPKTAITPVVLFAASTQLWISCRLHGLHH